MINRSVATPEVEPRPDARLDVPHGRSHRVAHHVVVVVGPIRGAGEGDAAGDCCYMYVGDQPVVLLARRMLVGIVGREVC